jgi:anti-sigma-K factor RskA
MTDQLSENRDDEQLVAYLDGELELEDARRIEDRLAFDSEFRTRLKELQQSWDLLDVLPRSETDEKFTTSTISLVALKAAEDVQHETTRTRRSGWMHGFWVAVVTLLLTFVGFKAYDFWLERDNDRLLRDLAVIDRVDLYRNIDNIDFLLKLETEAQFGDEVAEDAK